MQNILEIKFKNIFVESFLGDHSLDSSSRETLGVLYAKINPTPVSGPVLLAWSSDLASELGMPFPKNPQELGLFAGNNLNPSMIPYSARYGGHQFGHWAGQLGDGRAITLGEIHLAEKKIYEIQLKGAGVTPYSRRGDGRAVLRSSLREFVMSEAMFYLNVPTTRALCLVTTGDDVVRDMFYNGRPEYEPGAIVTRIAPSFLRFGNFEILFAKGEIENLKKLTMWTIDRFYPQIYGDNFESKVFLFFKEVCEHSLLMVIEWLRVGFVHGVMNTDNMSILGLTIDYGPFSMMDQYQEDFTPNTTDLPGRRYAFIKQPSILFWNLQRLATALSGLVNAQNIFENYLANFEQNFLDQYYKMMSAKLGLRGQPSEEIINLVQLLKEVLVLGHFDMTLFFVKFKSAISEDKLEHKIKILQEASYLTICPEVGEKIKFFFNLYTSIVTNSHLQIKDIEQVMSKENPQFIPRNYLLHQCAQELERGDSSLLDRLMKALKNPYSEGLQKDDPDLLKLAPDWATRTPGCSTLSCSS